MYYLHIPVWRVSPSCTYHSKHNANAIHTISNSKLQLAQNTTFQSWTLPLYMVVAVECVCSTASWGARAVLMEHARRRGSTRSGWSPRREVKENSCWWGVWGQAAFGRQVVGKICWRGRKLQESICIGRRHKTLGRWVTFVILFWSGGHWTPAWPKPTPGGIYDGWGGRGRDSSVGSGRWNLE